MIVCSGISMSGSGLRWMIMAGSLRGTWFTVRARVVSAPVGLRRLAVLASVAIATPACGAGDDRKVTVLAASSLTEVFDRIEAAHEAAHADVDIVVSYAGSATLAAQIEAGADADVFASADVANMARVVADELVVGEPVAFARNALTIAVEPGNPLGLRDLADLADDEVVVVLAAPEVPAGAYAEEVLEAAGVVVDVASYEQNVRAVVSKIALGEADAGLVYRTDVSAAGGRVEAVPIDSAVVATYVIAALDESADATAFLATVLGPAGRTALVDAGFGLP